MSYSNGPRIVTNGLVLCLDAGNSKSYPGSGSTWRDLSGNNRNFSLVNTYSYSSNNKGFITFTRTMPPTSEFAGYAQHAGVGSLSSAYLYANHTTEVVARINNINPTLHDATEGNSALFVYQGYHSMFSYTASLLRYSIWNGTSNQVFAPTLALGTSSGDILQDRWFAVSVTRTGNILSTYLNGILKDSITVTAPVNGNASTNLLRIALASDTSQQYSWAGASSVAAVRMYNRALSASEIAQNHNAVKGRFNL